MPAWAIARCVVVETTERVAAVETKPTKQRQSKAEQLDEVGIKKDQASRLEQMAAVPEEAFEELANAEAATAAGREITSTAARLTR